MLRKLALIQGIFYVVTGLWPLIHMPSFLQVTGPKTDLWLVRTVGVLVTVAIDTIHVLSQVIPPIYLADAAVEIGLAACWAVAWQRSDA